MITECQSCGVALSAQMAQGRPVKFCGTTCRMRAYRARKAAVEIPGTMRRRPRWIRRDAEKRPLTVHGWYASVKRPHTWSTFARASASEVGTGLGFVLGDGIGCIDLDHCIGPDGVLEPWAARYVKRFRESAIMIEKSMSGRGVHIFIPMRETRGRMIRLPGRSIEIYSWRRYIAVTGERI